MIPFWGIYSQMSTVFQNQACQMNLNMAGDAQIPVTALNVFDSLAIILLVPVFDQVLFPYLSRIGYPQSMLQRMGWGFFFAVLSMVAAAVLEAVRLQRAPPPGNYYDPSARANISPCANVDNFNPHKYSEWYAGLSSFRPLNCGQTCADTFTVVPGGPAYLNSTCIACDNIPQVTDLSVLWQIIQFALVGCAEILASVASLEFFYSQAPSTMKSVTQALNLFTCAWGSFVLIPILLIVNADPHDEWVPANVDEGHLDWYFWLLAVLMLADLGVFYFLSRRYEYKSAAEVTMREEEQEGLTDGTAGGGRESVSTRSVLHSASIGDTEYEMVGRREYNQDEDQLSTALDASLHRGGD